MIWKVLEINTGSSGTIILAQIAAYLLLIALTPVNPHVK